MDENTTKIYDDLEEIYSNNSIANMSVGRIPWMYDLTVGDTNWIITASFIIFTMQTGFGLLESGAVSIKNEVNIMMKNVVDIVLGGFTYWMFGYGLSFGRGEFTNPFVSLGDFFLDPAVDNPLMGAMFAAFLFQLSFATTATTIVSGAMAERCNFKAYCLFSLLNTIVYCVPAGWVWSETGFLNQLGVVDIAGSGPVHLVGGASAFASAWMLGPRLGRYMNGIEPLPLGSPVNAVMGLFVLWWGWLAFNSGSTYGLSNSKWHYAARAAVMTMLSSFGGGTWGLLYALFVSGGETIDLMTIINSILGSLVGVTAGCFLYQAWEAILIGIVGGALACITAPLIDKLGIDDPVGATSVHGFCGIWGVIAVGLFAGDPKPLGTTSGRVGLFRGGGWYLFGVQCLSALCLGTWSFVISVILLWFVNKIIPIRMDAHSELLGADLSEHKIRHGQVGVSRALSALRPALNNSEIHEVTHIGHNPGHNAYLQEFYSLTHNPSSYKLNHLLPETDLKILQRSRTIQPILSDSKPANKKEDRKLPQHKPAESLQPRPFVPPTRYGNGLQTFDSKSEISSNSKINIRPTRSNLNEARVRSRLNNDNSSVNNNEKRTPLYAWIL